MPVACPVVRAVDQTTPAPITATSTAPAFTVFLIRCLPQKTKNAEPAKPAEKNPLRSRRALRSRRTSDFVLRTSLRGRGRLLRQDLAEHLNRLGHLFHRAERDAGVGLLERREIAGDQEAPGAAGGPGRGRRGGGGG